MSTVLGWNPIDSAPKGPPSKAVYLLGFCPGEFNNPKACISIIWWEESEQAWFSEYDYDKGVKPSHWMPLPEPPR